MSQRFTLDRQSFEQFIAAVSLFQPLQKADARKRNGEAPLLLHLLETFRDVDSGVLTLQAALERVAELTLRIVGGDGAAVWLFTSEDLFCRAVAGVSFEDDHIRSVLRSKLQCAGAFGEDPPAKLDLARTLADCLGGIGSWLVIAILPGGNIAGGLAVYSSQSAAYTSRDFVHLRLLAELAQYVATTSRRPMPIEDVYLPGLGTRAALGGDVDIDGRPHLGTILRERRERLTASVTGLVSSAAGIARDGVAAGAQSLKKTASSLGQPPTLHLPAGRQSHPTHSENVRRRRSTLWLAVRSMVSGLKSSHPSEQVTMLVQQIMKKLRRLRFLSLKLLCDVHEYVSTTWECWVRGRTAAGEQFSKEASQEVRLWVAQWSTAKARVRSWVAKQFAARVNALGPSASDVPIGAFSSRSKAISPASSRLASEAGHSPTRLQSLLGSVRQKSQVGVQRLWSAIMKAGNTLGRVRNVEVNHRALRKASPAVAILGVMFFFVFLQIPDSKPSASSSLSTTHETAAHPAVSTSGNHLKLAAAVITSSSKSEPVPSESSHLRVTDPATEMTITELSRYEIRNLPRAADYGDDEAALQLGMLYELGVSVPQNCSKAAEWVTKAAQDGNPAAEYNLALRYRDGDGVSANLQESEDWFRKAALDKVRLRSEY